MNPVADFGSRASLMDTSSTITSAYGLTDVSPDDFCFIDEETVKTLELVDNNADSSNRKHTLLGYLNTSTSTTTGARLLKQAILRPFSNHEIIDQRLDCIEYLVGRVDTLAIISNNIKRYGLGVDLDAVIPCLVNLTKNRVPNLTMGERKLDALITLESLLTQINPLVMALDGADQETLNVAKTALQDPAFGDILTEISSVIESDVRSSSRGKRCKMFRIKAGFLALFDVARSTYHAAVDDLEQYVRELQKEDGLGWKLAHNDTRGYYITLSADQLPRNQILGPRYLQVNKTRSIISCTTREIMQSNVRANVSYENSMKLANEIMTSCLTSIMNRITSIHRLVEVVGTLDLITSFAKLVTNSNGTLSRPKFSATDNIIHKSRHPVLESVLRVSNLAVVTNDILLSTTGQNFMLVTGPNMGGKSVYLKQAGILQVMAQIGCYVPAESAHIKIMNKIVARSGTTDDSQSNCSSFTYEMRGIATALQSSEARFGQSVLYLIDEVGRGTTIDDGASYSFAIAEELALRRFCFTIFATHFDQVFTLKKLYNNVGVYHFKYEEEVDSNCENARLNLTHELVMGQAEKTNYGIKLAEACGFPQEILRAARTDAGWAI